MHAFLPVATGVIGRHILFYEELTSTNVEALALSKETPPEGTVVIAAQQTQGKGQAGNYWISEPHANLTLSFILYPRFVAIGGLFSLSKMVAIAVRNTVQYFLPHRTVSIKWANDILVENQKIAGILIENQISESVIKATVVGIGLNVNQMNFPSFPTTPTSLALCQENREPCDIPTVFSVLCVELEKAYHWLRIQPTLIDALYLSHLFGLNTLLPMQAGGIVFEGMIRGITSQGLLEVQIKNERKTFEIKEIKLLI